MITLYQHSWLYNKHITLVFYCLFGLSFVSNGFATVYKVLDHQGNWLLTDKAGSEGEVLQLPEIFEDLKSYFDTKMNLVLEEKKQKEISLIRSYTDRIIALEDELNDQSIDADRAILLKKQLDELRQQLIGRQQSLPKKLALWREAWFEKQETVLEKNNDAQDGLESVNGSFIEDPENNLNAMYQLDAVTLNIQHLEKTIQEAQRNYQSTQQYEIRLAAEKKKLRHLQSILLQDE